MCVYILINGICVSLGWTEIFCWISTYGRTPFIFFRKCNYNIQNANWSKERGICIDYLYTFCKQESIPVCKLVTVSCLSQYSGCKCILTLTNETISLGQAYSYTFLLVWFNGDRQTDRHIAYGTLMITWMCLSIDFISLLRFWNLGTMLNRAVCLFWCLL